MTINLSSMRLTKKHLKNHIQLLLKGIVKTEKLWDLFLSSTVTIAATQAINASFFIRLLVTITL